MFSTGHPVNAMKSKSVNKGVSRIKSVLQKIFAFSMTVAVTLSSLNLSGVNLEKAYAVEQEKVLFDKDTNTVDPTLTFTKVNMHNKSDDNVDSNAHAGFGLNDSRTSISGHASHAGAFYRAQTQAIDLKDAKSITITARAQCDGGSLHEVASFSYRIVNQSNKYSDDYTVKDKDGNYCVYSYKKANGNLSCSFKDYTSHTFYLPDNMTSGNYYIVFYVKHGNADGDKYGANTINAYVNHVGIVYDVTPPPQDASINVNPSSISVDYGGSVTLTATGTIPNGVKWSNGATTTSITVSNVTSNATYSCTAYGKDGGSNSVKSATITVNNPSFTTNLNTQTSMDPNSSTILSVAAKSYSKVEWYKKNGATWSKVGDGLSYRVTDSAGNQNNAQYKAIAYGANSKSVTSNICTVKINPASITDNTFPVNKTVLEDQSATFECKVKNAKSIQWQKRAYDGAWENIPGQTESILVLNDCKVEDSGSFFRAFITGYTGDVTATRDGVLLTVNRRIPALVVSDQVVLESETATFTAQTDSYAKSIKWYCKKEGESTFKELKNSTGAIVSDEPYFEGCNTTTLKIRNATLDYHNSTIKCVVTNVDTSNEKTAAFSVISKQIDSVHVEYPQDDIAFGQVLDLKDVYVIVRYNNRDASLGKNFEGLTFEDGSTRKVMDELGEQKYKVKITLGGQSYVSTLDVVVADKTAPVITSLTAKWKESGETVSSNNITNDTTQAIVLSASATDNCKADADLEYTWKIGNTRIGTGKTVEIGTNGTYTVFVSDGINVSEKEIEVKAYDTLNPTITDIRITPDDEYSTYRIVTVVATDDTLLAELPYSKDGVRWQKGNAFYFGKDATVTMYVKDCVGNIVQREVEVTHIDNDIPVIDKTERTVEGNKVMLQVFAHDDTSGVTYGYKNDKGIEWNHTGKFEIEKDSMRDSSGRTFYVRDEAGNMAYTVVYISSEAFDNNVIKDLLDASLEKDTDDWVSAETGVKLTCNLADAKIEQYKLYPSYTWNDDTIGEVTEKTVTVHKNGSYAVTLCTKDANGNKLAHNTITSKSISVNNIDSQKPVCNSVEDIINNNGIISGTAKDKQSGIAQVSVKGGSKAFKDGKVIVDNTEDYLKTQRFDFTVYESGDYLITITDRVGNQTEITYPVEIDTRVPLNPEQVGNDLHMISW